jgi:UDP-N-acetylmuramyl pentapeptide synthase
MGPGSVLVAADAAEAAAIVRAACSERDVILVKASRGVELERVVEALAPGTARGARP